MKAVKKERYFRSIVIALIVFVSLILVMTAISLLVQFSNQVAEEAAAKAELNTTMAREAVEESLRQYTAKAVAAATNLSNKTDKNDALTYLVNLRGEDRDLLFCRFLKDGVLYTQSEEPFDGEDTVFSYIQNHGRTAGYIGCFEDDTTHEEGVMSIIGFYAPIDNSAFFDGIVIYYTQSQLSEFFPIERRSELAEISVLCKSDGIILVGQDQVDNFEIKSALRTMVGDKSPIDQLNGLLIRHETGTVFTSISGDQYLISVVTNPDTMEDLSIVELYRSDVLHESSFNLIRTITSIFILICIIASVMILYLVVHRMRMNKELLQRETTDKTLACLNRNGFEMEARDILSRNPGSYFTVIVFQLRHYKYLLENFGNAEVDQLLYHLRMVSSKMIQVEELYGYLEDGHFLLLLHDKDRQSLISRLRIHASLASRYQGANKFDVLLKYGIYELDNREHVTVSQMIDFADEANNTISQSTEDNATMQFNFYNSELRRIRLLNEDMELRMEGALQNGEFQVFFQPKYNLHRNTQDGAEALVRWYDKKTNKYNVPALFMPLFESNGFIIKLDRYVFTKVCEFIRYSIANGLPVYPVSVNISRITAVQPDFIDFYSKVKQKYGIADGQLMIEFTESFAYENYETLFGIVQQLHENGFKCSIDDFGSGYSSYRILKSLPMDEIKLDRFFIEKGVSEKCDTAIMESIITLGKHLGMKVTQEGVEEEEDLFRIRKLGCDVVQGYLYSKPISLSDYITFNENSREHKLPDIK